MIAFNVCPWKVLELVDNGRQIKTCLIIAFGEGMEAGPIVSEMVAPPLNRIELATKFYVNGHARHQVDSVVYANFG